MANLPCECIAVGGGYADEQERLLQFLLLFIFFTFFSTLTPSSFIPRSLDLHIRQVDDCVADDKEVMLDGGQVDMQAEEVEEHVGVVLSVGIVGKKNYEEPECGSAADFLLGVEMEGDPPGRMEVEGDALMAVETDLFFNANDSNKCQCPSQIVKSTTAVDDANVGTDFVVVDILAVDDNTNVGKDQVHKDALAVGDIHILADCVDDNQVDEDLLADDDVHLAQPSKPIQTLPKTSNKWWGPQNNRHN